MVRFAALLLALVLAACGGGMDRLGGGPAQGLVGILVTPEEVVVPEGSTVRLVATGLYDDRRTRDLTAVVTWRSADPRVVRADLRLDHEGEFAARGLGVADVEARLDGIRSPPARVRVTDQQITAISVEPPEVVVAPGQQVQLVATATFSDGERGDVTALVRWITDDGSVATLDGGVLAGQAAGRTAIRAQHDAIASNDVPVDVVAQAAADLRIATLTASPYAGSVSLVIEVENTGSAGASDFWVDAFADFPGAPGPGDAGDDYARVAWVGPGDTVQVVLGIDGLSAGQHGLDVVVDIEREVAESDESDNHETASVTVPDAGGTGPAGYDPDLAVDRVDFLSDGTWVYYEVEVSNYGDRGVGPFWVDLYVDRWGAPQVGQDGDDWVEVPWIGPWDTVVIEFLVAADCTWGCDSWVFADSYDDVDEPVEWDNLWGPVSVD